MKLTAVDLRLNGVYLRLNGVYLRLIGGILFSLISVLPVSGQHHYISGTLYDEKASPLESGTVVLLHPSDSTLEFYGITDRYGRFEIRNVKQGRYLLQASYVGYRSIYAGLDIPRPQGPQLGDLILEPLPVNLDGAEVVGEAVPLQIRGDTVEYNAAAFRTGPDAMTEDLLKKMPGIDVDRSGNIKALGEDVSRLYVDGKEFFGSDPRIATRNIPADAIDRVQLYDRRSDLADFTGVDDGSREKTINLKLQEDKKKGVFGSLLAGYGPGNRYKGNAKAYRFTDRIQAAGLAMINNVNQYGFSFSDYLDFQGGISAKMGGAGSARIRIGGGNSFPVNFGQPVDGLTTSGAGGVNLSYSRDRHNRYYISYLGDGSLKKLHRSVSSRTFTGEGSYRTDTDTHRRTDDRAHRINFGMRRRVDSAYSLILGGNVSLMDRTLALQGITENRMEDMLLSRLESNRDEGNSRLQGDLSGSFYRILGNRRNTLKILASAGFSDGLEEINILDRTGYGPENPEETGRRLQDNDTRSNSYSMEGHYTHRIGSGWYLTPGVSWSVDRDILERSQMNMPAHQELSDSLSFSLENSYRRIRPGVRIQWNTVQSQLTIGLIGESGHMEEGLNGTSEARSYPFRFTPGLSWDYSWKTGRNIGFYYSSMIQAPAVSQLNPVVNDLNPLMIYRGNPELDPEYRHQVSANWLLFDQFSFTSLMMSVQGAYTSQKINWVTTITDSLVQYNTLTNVASDLGGGGHMDFSTPIRRLGLKINLNMEQDWNRGISVVNGTDNIYRTRTMRYDLSVENRKKKRWDLESGVGATFTRTRYNIQPSLNNRYFDLSWFADLYVQPSDHWTVELSADITNYADRGFDESILVPLLRAELSYHFLKFRRGVLTLAGFDLLDRNQIVDRISELNYLRETRSSTIGRYFLLTFKYRLNKMERSDGIQVEMNHRR